MEILRSEKQTRRSRGTSSTIERKAVSTYDRSAKERKGRRETPLYSLLQKAREDRKSREKTLGRLHRIILEGRSEEEIFFFTCVRKGRKKKRRHIIIALVEQCMQRNHSLGLLGCYFVPSYISRRRLSSVAGVCSLTTLL